MSAPPKIVAEVCRWVDKAAGCHERKAGGGTIRKGTGIMEKWKPDGNLPPFKIEVPKMPEGYYCQSPKIPDPDDYSTQPSLSIIKASKAQPVII